MDDIRSLLELPLETIVILVSGYVGYRIAFTEITQSRRPVDTFFLVLSFALVAKLSFDRASASDLNSGVSALIAILVTLGFGIVWRKWLSRGIRQLLRWADVTYSDGTESAVQAIVSDTTVRMTELSVILKSGEILCCDDLSEYQNEPHGPCIVGPDGSVALYVTSRKRAGGAEYEDVDPKTDAEDGKNYWGSKITYIPAGQIERVAIRSRKR